MDVLFLLVALLIGALAGYFFAHRLSAGDTVARSEFEALSSELAVSRAQVTNLQQRENEQKQQSQSLQLELRTAREKSVALETEREGFARQIQQQQADLQKMEQKLSLSFENLANKIFEEKSASFKKQSQESIGELLQPLREKMGEFQKKVDESFGTQAKEQFALKAEIERIVKVNEKMTLGAENLTKALRGDVQVQGNWGEVMLEKILEESGLRRDEDYVLQGEELGLKHVESGGHLRPDVVVNLPDEKHIIIDSKVSLVHYEGFVSAIDELERSALLKQFVSSVKNHVIGLEKKRYQDTDKIGAPDFVLLFMPIEGAYALAVQTDKELHSFAWDKRIVIVCPSTLFATLRTIASIWKIERQNKNSEKIAKLGGALYDKIAAFVSDMDRLGNQIETVKRSYDGAMTKLSSGKGNILARTQLLHDYGAKTSKKLSISGEELLEEQELLEE